MAAESDPIIAERIERLREEIAYLKTERETVSSYQEYASNVRLKRAVERSLQVAIEICLDIGRRIIAVEGLRHPEENREVFVVLHEAGILPEDLLPALINMARFRNLIVHDYARIDDAQVYAILKRHLHDFEAYARAIARYLEQR